MYRRLGLGIRRAFKDGLNVPAELSRGSGLVLCKVTDPVDVPVAGGEFTLTDETGRREQHGRTDPDGRVTALVPLGNYRLTVRAEGYQAETVPVTVLDPVPHVTSAHLRLAFTPTPALPAPGDWEIDPTHSHIGFVARHIGLARVHGRFDHFAGAILVHDPIERSAMHVVIDAGSINTNVQMRDDHLRSADFLDVEGFPTLEFYSDRVVSKGGRRWAVTGALSLHGVTRSVTLDTQFLGMANGMDGELRAAFHAETELHREDFTVSWQSMLAKGIAVVGSSITIELDVQLVRKEGTAFGIEG